MYDNDDDAVADNVNNSNQVCFKNISEQKINKNQQTTVATSINNLSIVWWSTCIFSGRPWQTPAVEQRRSRCLPRDVTQQVLAAHTTSRNRSTTSASLGISRRTPRPSPTRHHHLNSIQHASPLLLLRPSFSLKLLAQKTTNSIHTFYKQNQNSWINSYSSYRMYTCKRNKHNL